MAHIKVTKGLDIPIEGKPEGNILQLIPSGAASPLAAPSHLALDLTPYEETKFHLLAKVGDLVKRGQPLVEDKDFLGRMFVSPAGGTVKEIRRGLKRRLLDIVIEVSKTEEIEQNPPVDLSKIDREELLGTLERGGLMAHMRQRPFNLLANPQKIPRSIFVKAIESVPLTPPAEMQVQGQESAFQYGLEALARLTTGKVHLVHRKGTSCRAFLDAKNVVIHTVEGPHPAGNVSLHIQEIDPIRSPEDVIWTLNAHDVVAMGHFLKTGTYYVDRVISIAGPGILEGMTGYFRVREGYPISVLISGRLKKGLVRLISGDVLMGRKVDSGDFLGYYDYGVCAVPENLTRQFLSFMRLGTDEFTASGAYLSGHFDNTRREYAFTTNQHGEHRFFIDSSLYDRVMPLDVETMPLVKAILAEDYDLAAELGLLEVDGEDFALPTFVCPSKMEMVDIVKRGLKRYATDTLK